MSDIKKYVPLWDKWEIVGTIGSGLYGTVYKIKSDDVFGAVKHIELVLPENADDMVKDAPTIDQIMPKVLEFMKGSVLVAHNADFDIGYMKYNCEQLGLDFDFTHIDTLRLAKAIYPEFSRYKLGFIADKLGIKVEVAHRALDGVKTLVAVFKEMIENKYGKEAR